MKFAQLNKYIKAKYGCTFKPAKGLRGLAVLTSPLNHSYFAMLSYLPKRQAQLRGQGKITTLDLRCGDFASVIRDLPGFSSPFRLKDKDWVGVWLDRVAPAAVEKAFDYAFELAMNGPKQSIRQQYLYLPGQSGTSKYQAQPIRPRPKSRGIPSRLKYRSSIPAAIQTMQESYDYSLLPAKGKAKNFYHQGRLMASYRDHFSDHFSFQRYFPTYHEMNVPQLRTYFSWRTQVREQHYQKIDSSYAYVYIYELLNQIGVKNPLQGYQALATFKNKYAQLFDLSLLPYLTRWLCDYVIYYHLPVKAVTSVFAKISQRDRQYHVLLHPKAYSTQEIVHALAFFSTYLKHSWLLRKQPQSFSKLLAQSWQEINALKQKIGHSFFREYLAQRMLTKKHLFAGAVFYRRVRVEKATPYVVDAERKYFVQDGNWYCSSLLPFKRQKTVLNTFLHEVERLSRQALHLGRALKPRQLAPVYLKAIKKGIAVFETAQRRAQQPQVKIDFQQLHQIRQDAAKTRESLLTKAEKEEELVAGQIAGKKAKYNRKPESKARKQKATINSQTKKLTRSYGLNQAQLYFLLALLKKTPWQDYLQDHHLMASILADQINSKLFDKIGDNVLTFDADNQPELIPDYCDDLKKMFLKKE